MEFLSTAAGTLASRNVSCTTERTGSTNYKLDRAPLGSIKTLTSITNQAFAKHESASNHGKKKEVMLNDVHVFACF